MLKLSAVLAVLGLALLILSAAPWPAHEAPAAGSAPAAGAAADAAYGKALFSAKGCVTCHHHAAIAGSGAFGWEDVPDLSAYRPNPEFLRRWLKDPSAVKAGAQMPTLGLSDQEIEALIAFLAANNSNG
jgi:cytochrome c oxidase subunit 2